MVPSLKRTQVIEKILKAGALGVTVLESTGKDTGERPVIRESRGTRQYVSEHSRFHTITAIVPDTIVEDVKAAIIDVTRTGSKEDGMIFVSFVDEAISIRTGAKIRENPEKVVSSDDLMKFSQMTDLQKKEWIVNKAREVKSLVQ